MTISVVYFKPGEDRDLLVVYGINSRGPEPENSDTLKGIHFLEVYKSDTIPATRTSACGKTGYMTNRIPTSCIQYGRYQRKFHPLIPLP